MVVNKNSWHYAVYDFSYALSAETTPWERTNLCQYMRRIMFVAPFIALLFAFFFVVATVATILSLLFMPIFGYLPSNWKRPWTIYDRSGTYKYQGLPLGKSYNAFQVYPWHVILVALGVGLEWAIYHYWGSHPLVVQGEIVGLLAAVVALVVGLFEFTYADSGTVKLFKEYVSAKKQKVCPVVEFTDKE